MIGGGGGGIREKISPWEDADVEGGDSWCILEELDSKSKVSSPSLLFWLEPKFIYMHFPLTYFQIKNFSVDGFVTMIGKVEALTSEPEQKAQLNAKADEIASR